MTERPPLAFRFRLALVLALAAANGAIYLLSNAHPLRTPVPLPRNALDMALGWHAWTIWPYWALLLSGPLLAVGISDRRLLAATLRAYATALALNLLIWSAWPTRLPRAPLPSDLDAPTAAAWRLLFGLDAPNNCFPSGHVTIPLVIAAGFCAQHPRAARWVWPMLLALLPSVVTTGQHYSVDVLGGAITAALGWWIAGREPQRGFNPAASGTG
jgi:hypothetical protein